jgi:hypothetical protein
MTEWWTYRPGDFLMFSPRIYWRLFEQANLAAWPLPLLLVAGAAAVLLWRRRAAARWLALLLAVAWAGSAWLFVHERYVPIHWAVAAAVPAFVLQALLLAWAAASAHTPVLPRHPVALGLASWALLLHPLLPWLQGRPGAQAELVGLAPDPTAIATLALLLVLPRRWPVRLAWPLPLAWCAFSGFTLATMGSAQAAVPLAAAALALGALIASVRSSPAR